MATPRALIVDNDLGFQAGLAELVTREGFAVATASTLKQARAEIFTNPPDILLVDLATASSTYGTATLRYELSHPSFLRIVAAVATRAVLRQISLRRTAWGEGARIRRPGRRGRGTQRRPRPAGCSAKPDGADVLDGSVPSPSGGATCVAVMQAPYLGEGHHLAGSSDRSWVRRVLAEREVRARAVVVREVRLEDLP
jgi:CheY-like chemotaxis protein